MSRWRPSPDEERWLEVASELGDAVPRAAVTERAGGWRSTGPLARIALFVLGFIAAVLAGALLFSIAGLDDEATLLVAGLVAVLAAEWLTVTRRLHASGVEEGLCLAGFLLVGLWITTLIAPRAGYAIGSVGTLVLIAAAGAAGLRRLNPLVTTGAVVAFVYWAGSTATARAIDQAIGGGVTALTVGCALAALALALGAREYRRPSHDRMLDWLVATLPIAAYARHATPDAYEVLRSPGDGTSQLATAVLLFALGAAMLFLGLRRRRHAPLLGFMGCLACLAVELRQVTTLATETWLMLYGFAALVAGVALDRYLRQPRNGLTSAALTRHEGPLDLLQTAGAAALAQRAAPESPRPEPPVTGGGGRFGGGGATGSY
ncbi:MAG: hypothetical protein WCF43_06065 [Steroidobacteraceae bacterium]